MKKLIIGFIAGAIFMFSSQAIADTVSLVGKKVGSEAKVILNGKEISGAIIVNSKSYTPARDVAEALGAGVEWKDGVVHINTFPMADKIFFLKNQIKNKEREIAELDRINENARMNLLPELKEKLDRMDKDTYLYELNKGTYDEYVSKTEESEQKANDLKEEIKELEKEISELESAK